ncbi:hypothetical protein TVNIR_3075 [Thioalkalivibrio nitratireducens DSM 14787]|uniref:Uncharacterized protein n=1 Tax=Thioalkalivibrio nitratireducens (strain DSM 14787 / UNIQEM 213 / ALEN2) TaxID=1255043 RepID=L0E0D8_THIND|nr:hypothetical protein [Thioalkalivibrio nitratireducens]AGA34712.1 hypothetical protein TVNIR_3075 [Thioalkalivibrio nitratireducens DSM 14787]
MTITSKQSGTNAGWRMTLRSSGLPAAHGGFDKEAAYETDRFRGHG